jgi:predicted dehydrogenase
MNDRRHTRRRLLQSSLAFAGAHVLTRRVPRAAGFESANQRPRIAAIGTGSRWYQRATGLDSEHGSAPEMRAYGDYIAVCDADAQRLGRAADIVRGWSGMTPQAVSDYRAIIDRPDVDVVHISTPDHWHAKIAIEAMRAGKDVYCEKPLTLTIAEGRQVCAACRDTGRIVQVGTQQRSDRAFLTAIALVRDGRIGRLRMATCRIGGGPTSPPLPQVDPPKHLDWNLWTGPAPLAPFRFLAGDNGETNSWSRGHYEFRWWYEYSGGKLTDWGAHHVDIAAWAMEKTETGPLSIKPVKVAHPVPFAKGYPLDRSQYNTATEFVIKAEYADGQELEIRDDGDNGILLEGTEGRIFVNRGRLSGRAVDDLATRPLPDGALEAVYKHRPLVDHFRNFFEAVASRAEPISDVHSHHRALTTCHLSAIAARLGRPIRWDPEAERILDDPEAQRMVARESRRGFEIEG